MFPPASMSITRSLLRHGLQSAPPRIVRSTLPCAIICHHRTFRLKPSASKTAEARYDRYLKILEKKFRAAKERRDKEEADLQMRTYPLDKDAQSSTNPLFMFGSDGFMSGHNNYFWDHMLNEEQRTRLKSYNISTYEELIAAADAAESTMGSPPHPSMEQLKPRLRHAYQIKKDIDSKHVETFSSQ